MILNRIFNGSVVISGSCRAGIFAYFRSFTRSVAAVKTKYQNILPVGSVNLNGQNGVSTAVKGIRLLHSSKSSPITCISRAVLFEDVQMYKVVHGGVYLEMAEEAGDMIVSQHYAEGGNNCNIPVIPAMVKVEKSLFIDKTELGEILVAEGEVIFTAPRSLRVLVSLYASRLVGGGDRRLVSRSWLWYVILNGNDHNEVLPVQLMPPKDPALEREGKLEHEKNEVDRQRLMIVRNEPSLEYCSSLGAQSSHIVSRSWCGSKPFSRAGPVLKWMDELIGVVAVNFTQTICVTGLCDDINFFSKLMPGGLVTLTATPVFTSGKSVDIQCFADIETISNGRRIKERAVEAFFTYVALNKSSKQNFTIRQITPTSDKEKAIYEQRFKLYQERKQGSKNSSQVDRQK